MIVEIDVATSLHPDGRLSLADDRLDGFHNRLEDSADAAPARLVYAATHIVMRESYRGVDHSTDRPGPADRIAEHVDWDATMRLRQRLDGQGFAVAEAMDTAQRFSLGFAGARRLIEGCGALQLANGFVAGAGTDHLSNVPDTTALIDAVVHQASMIRAAGGEVIVLPMPQLTRWRADSATYVDVYRSIIEQVDGPIYVHWLGAMFLAELEGYFPDDSFARVMAIDPGKVRGAKISLLDRDLEVDLRQRLRAEDQILLTGDDFHFASLIAGGDRDPAPVEGSTKVGARDVPTGDFSHALLGIFDGIASPASLALRFLSRGDHDAYFELMEPCEALSRVIFREPTCYYKSGLAFLAWLNGEQDNFMLVNHEEAARGPDYYVRVADLASRAGVLQDANLAARRVEQFLEST